MSSFIYNRRLDGIRGIAVLFVMLCHQTIFKATSSFEKVWYALFSTGWMGVDLFFVLSGFLITSILIVEKGTPNYFINFYMRRFLRIVPLYYLILFLFFFIVPQLPSGWTKNLEEFKGSTVWFWAFLSNFYIASVGRWIQPPLSPSWSLCIEEQFYFLWPFLVSRLTLDSLNKLCKGIVLFSILTRIAMALLGLHPIAIYILPFSRMDTLALGAIIAIHYGINPNRLKVFTSQSHSFLWVFLALGVYISGFVGRDSIWMAFFGFSFVAIAASYILLIVLSEKRNRINQLLNHPMLVFIGKYSYGIYLLHIPVVGLIATLVFSPTTWPQQIIFYIVCCPLTLFLAFLSYHFYEKHFLSLKKYFEYRKEEADFFRVPQKVPDMRT